jgi:cupin 2 domain-containing protein
VLSGVLEQPADYCQEHDEWALVVGGSASLLVGTEMLQLEAGDWVWLPAGTPHRLVRTQPGTSWVTVHSTPSTKGQGTSGPA